MDNTYIFSMQEHLEVIKSDLQGLHDISHVRTLGRYEYRAAERSLQVLIETCIGIAKHWSYALNKTAPADAYSAFETLAQLGISDIDMLSWRKVIGMRNALVHDYLNTDPEIIRLVIQNKDFDRLFIFSEQGLLALLNIANNQS